jgi:hypothetical protein
MTAETTTTDVIDAILPGDGPPYRVSYPVTADAAIDAARLAMAPLRRRMTFVSLGALVFGVVLCLAGDWTFGPAIVMFGLLTLALTILRGPERWLVNRRGRSLLGGSAELVFRDEGVDFATPQASGRVAWSALTEARDDERSVILLRDRILVGYAPVVSFGPPERRAEIVDYIRERITTARSSPPA